MTSGFKARAIRRASAANVDDQVYDAHDGVPEANAIRRPSRAKESDEIA